MGSPPRPRGADSEEVLRDWGFARAEIEELEEAGVVGAAKV
jgi:crotonobetainyl-CoA:carnitine CoA-transferase CaiB-like acyl-CoA transferase